MLPPELVELIVGYGWQCLSTSSHRHAYSMTCWMLVSREWLSIVVPIFLRDASQISYLAQNCRSLTVSIYQRRGGEYDSQCAELAQYAADPSRANVVNVASWGTGREPYFGIPPGKIRNVIVDWFPNITSLHFVLVDCVPTYWYWGMEYDVQTSWFGEWYPDCLTDLHVTFAYTSPPPPLLAGAPRGTFFPPRCVSDLPDSDLPDFTAVKRLVVRDANADFVAFLTSCCPSLECIECTAEFGVDEAIFPLLGQMRTLPPPRKRTLLPPRSTLLRS
ncbi:hypothetical protein FB45DRAFT_1045928 [Roridomyces roridus]|uniref:Uncharacterized protein n=1 Tax=Roridomyces roridus TaxID=1738132 RepID=A0AAD7AXZ3_9AGAR|nr:hypothetical protein FB45DRAFT_1045928 [Roridomyces roridus]